MPARHIKLSIALFTGLTAFATVFGQGREENTLESAKRDLQGLPNVQQLPASRTVLPELNISLPSMTGQKNSQAPSKGSTLVEEPVASRGWLLDALDERRARSRFSSTGDKGADEELLRKRKEAQNPFDHYLRNWLTARDQKLLLPTRDGLEGSRDSNSLEPALDRRSGTYDSRPLLGRAPSSSGASAKIQANPYLENQLVEEDTFRSFAPLTPAGSSAPSQSAIESAIPVNGPSASGNNRPDLSSDDHYVPPTAPLLNERLYFPQLRKF